jgi:hypothetical protein
MHNVINGPSLERLCELSENRNSQIVDSLLISNLAESLGSHLKYGLRSQNIARNRAKYGSNVMVLSNKKKHSDPRNYLATIWSFKSLFVVLLYSIVILISRISVDNDRYKQVTKTHVNLQMGRFYFLVDCYSCYHHYNNR